MSLWSKVSRAVDNAFGFSSASLVDLIVAEAETAASEADLRRSLVSLDLPLSQVTAVVDQIWPQLQQTPEPPPKRQAVATESAPPPVLSRPAPLFEDDEEATRALHSRLIQKDRAKTGRLAGAKDSTLNDAALPAPSGDDAMDAYIAAKLGRDKRLKHKEEYLDRLRVEARREYLKKREVEQIQLEERVLQDSGYRRCLTFSHLCRGNGASGDGSHP